ncbi:MAG: AEC family transporter [Candidatus Accumulibacter sp.]|jgi:predicted permease|nr:AEC family transporter [Accumulibacter sp.]
MELTLRIIGIITPVMIVSAMGYAYARLRKPDMTWINRLSTDLLFPLLIYTSMASKAFDIRQFLPLIAGSLLVILGSGLIAWGVARFLGYNPRAFVPSMMFPNVGNMGLPLSLLAFGPEALPAAIALFITGNLSHFSFGIRICAPNVSVKNILRGPMLWATIAGIVSSLAGFALPEWIASSTRMLGDTAIPLGLFTLGVGFAGFKVERWSVGIVGAALRPLAGLALAWPLAYLLPLSPMLQGVLLLNASLPPAVMNYILADRYQQEPERVAAIVVVGNIASVFFVPLSLYLAF